MKNLFSFVVAFILTLIIPLLLCATVWQSSRYAMLAREVRDYEIEQERLIAGNKRKISGIAVLAKPERIEKIAVEELFMRKAPSEDILRIELKKKKDG